MSEPRTAAIFVQAPADLPFALSIYDDKHRRGKPVELFVRARSIYEFVRGLPLDGAVVSLLDDGFTSFPKTPRAIVRVRSRLQATYRAHFQAVPGEAYFFTPLMDVTTSCFVSRLARRCPVFLADHYRLRDPELTRWGPKTWAKWSLLKFITGVGFAFCVREEIDRAIYAVLPHERCGIKLIEPHIDPHVVERYRFRTRPAAGPAALLFVWDDEEVGFLRDSRESFRWMADCLLRQGFRVYIKPHPRLGHPGFLERMNVRLLPAGVPAEFLDLEQFDVRVGVDSLALARTAVASGSPSVSLVNLVGFRDSATPGRIRQWLDQHGEGRIVYPDTEAEFLSLLEAVNSRPRVAAMTQSSRVTS